jgi:hypothetical protein
MVSFFLSGAPLPPAMVQSMKIERNVEALHYITRDVHKARDMQELERCKVLLLQAVLTCALYILTGLP